MAFVATKAAKPSRRKALLALIRSPDRHADVEADLTAYFGPNCDVYLTHYRRLIDKGRPITWSWHWPFFLVGYVWAFYRKLYGLAALLLVAPFVLAVMGYANSAGQLSYTVALAMIGKSLYVNEGLRQIVRADQRDLQGEVRRAFLARRGGTSRFAGGLAAVFFAIQILSVVVVLAHRHHG